jgi:alpha,alpha-trehalose phosphorylase
VRGRFFGVNSILRPIRFAMEQELLDLSVGSAMGLNDWPNQGCPEEGDPLVENARSSMGSTKHGLSYTEEAYGFAKRGQTICNVRIAKR